MRTINYYTPDQQLTPPESSYLCVTCGMGTYYDEPVCEECRKNDAIDLLEREYYIIKKANNETIKRNLKEWATNLAIGFAAWITAVTISVFAYTIIW